MSFKLLDRVAGRALDTALGGKVTVRPQTLAGQYGGSQPDASRPQRSSVAHFQSDPKTDDFRGSVIGTEVKGGTRLSVPGETTVLFTRQQYDALGYDLRKGDLITFEDEPGTPTFGVAKNPHRQGQDVEIVLTREIAP